jgi:hypothetical protein
VSDLTAAAASWLALHHGIITTSELQRCGVGRRTQARLVERGVLIPLFKGVFAVASAPRSLHQRCVALCAAHPRGFVTGPTAGALLGLRRMPASSAIHFSIRHGAKLAPVTGVRFRQTTALPPVDRRHCDDGIVVPSWPRLAFDLAADLRLLDHLSVLQQIIRDGNADATELASIGRRLAHPARPGSTRYLQSLSRLGGAPLESHPEVVLADALRDRGVPIEHQTRLAHLPDGRTARIDLAVPDVRWGVEVDIHPEHLTLDGHARDARRDRQVHMIGWQVEHVTEADMADVAQLADELATLYHLRLRSVDTRVSCADGVRQTLRAAKASDG